MLFWTFGLLESTQKKREKMNDVFYHTRKSKRTKTFEWGHAYFSPGADADLSGVAPGCCDEEAPVAVYLTPKGVMWVKKHYVPTPERHRVDFVPEDLRGPID
jgi:hypothetical protein